MKTWLCGMVLAAGVATAACGASPAPAQSITSETVLTIEPTPVVTVTVPPTSSVTTPAPAPVATKKTPVRKTPTRKPPQFGYQCRDGDEAKCDVCAGHKAWVDGQREFTDCLDSGGTWDIENQRCRRP